jgi:hypothetical protein
MVCVLGGGARRSLSAQQGRFVPDVYAQQTAEILEKFHAVVDGLPALSPAESTPPFVQLAR